MKTLILLLGILLFAQFNVKAQSLLLEGKLWCNTSIGSEGGNYESYYIKFEGETSINDVQYKIIRRSDDADHQSWYDYGFIREDENQKVYRYYKNSGSEELIYDFSLNVGDSIVVNFSGEYLYVEKVYYDTFGSSSDSLKHIQFQSGIEWVQGVGSIYGFLQNISIYFLIGKYYDLVCYYENDELVYQNPIYSSKFPEGTLFNNKFEIQKKNPIKISCQQNKITLSFNEINTLNSQLQLYNLAGKKILQTNLNGITEFQLSANEIKSGIYIYHFINNEISLSDKLIIK